MYRLTRIIKYFLKLIQNEIAHCFTTILENISTTNILGLSRLHITNYVTHIFDIVYQGDLVRETKQTYKLSNCLK